MKLYLLHKDTGGFSDAADYKDGIPYEAPEGTEWVEGEPEGLEGHRHVPLAEGLAKLFEEQPPAFRAKFAVLKAAVADRLAAGDLEAAKLLVESPESVLSELAVPPELKPVQDVMKEEIRKRVDKEAPLNDQ